MAEKQWYFDPSKPAEVPERLHDVLEKRGIPQSEIKLCIMTDLSPDMVRCDSWIRRSAGNGYTYHDHLRFCDAELAPVP